MKISGLTFFGFILTASTAMADNWDLARISLRLGIANVGWTVSEDFQTKKLLLEADLVFERIDQPVNEDKSMEQLNYLFDADLQFDNQPNEMDYAVVAFTYRAYQISRNLRSTRASRLYAISLSWLS